MPPRPVPSETCSASVLSLVAYSFLLGACGAGEHARSNTPSAPSSEVMFGEVFVLENEEEEVVARFLAIDLGPATGPLPRVEALGIYPVHSAYWAVYPEEEAPRPAQVVTLIGSEVHEARITGAQRMRGEYDVSGDEEARRSRELLAIFFEPESDARYGVVGTPVVRHVIEPASLPPASRELSDLVAWHDHDAEDSLEDEHIEPMRAFLLPEREIAIVVGHSRFVVHRGQVVQNGYGVPAAIVEAGPRLLIELESPTEGWWAPIEEFRPWPAPTQ